MDKWEIAKAYTEEAAAQFCADGWEPFAVTVERFGEMSRPHTTIHLKRRIKE